MLLAAFLSTQALALPSMEMTLKKLQENPQQFEHALPEKSAAPISHLMRVASSEMKLGCRQNQFGVMKEAPGLNDRAERLVDEPQKMVRSLQEMESKGWMKAKLPELPWSDSYWPLALGALANRYQDPFYDFDKNWKELFTYGTKTVSPQQLIKEDRHNELSPSEKYDLIMGDRSFTLTRAMWAEGEGYYTQYGNVESWMGLCHGWAPASFDLPQPKKSQTVKEPVSGKEVTLYVSDIKALGTLLYAKVDVPTKFIGGRCNAKDPAEVDGRISDPDCRDTNAGTWHLAVVNQIAGNRRSFVMDATQDYEVWNQPVVSYNYRYFQPQTKKLAASIDEGKLAVADFKEDVFKKYRAKEARFLIGVMMDVTYGVENSASTEEEQESYTRTVRYTYDLELNEKGQIVGGEWYQEAHPDFLWVTYKDERPATYGDNLFESWSAGERLAPESLRALKSNSQEGVPMSNVVRKLFEGATF